MENPEEILHSLEEFSKLKPKDIPRELEEYLCFVAKTGDPVYQWGTIKSLLREKLINVITDFYESCPSVEIPPCPNVEVFNYESMKTFILDKLDTFSAAPFTVQRICELLTSPRKQYNRIDKYMRALEKNILVVSTTEPGFRRSAENGDGIVNGLEADHTRDANSVGNDINVEEMDESPVWPRLQTEGNYQSDDTNTEIRNVQSEVISTAFCTDTRSLDNNCISTVESVITCRTSAEQPYVSIEPVVSDSCAREENVQDSDVTVTITAIPAAVQKRRDSIEPVVSSVDETVKILQSTECDVVKTTEQPEESTSSTTTETVPQEDVQLPSESEIETSDPASKVQHETEELNIVSDQSIESAPLIQIPIISEISSGVSCEDSQEAETNPVKEDDKSHTESLLGDQTIDPISDAITEVSTTVTSTVETEELKTITICESNAVISPVSQETSVSSTDDLSNDAADVLSVNRDQTCEEKTYISEDSLTDCIVDTNSGIAIEESESNNSDEVPFNNEEYASSSTSRDSMDIDIGEETCQEAATSGD
ncbi:serine/threonine-protein phosphatase 4 regulatory subunit 2 [Photinus pyralis]|uniref:serine/threonine-protein phosphatase 4 regulatory subunit 2 n=1 Tax=Photinus pyralis TaxID=7054 RepID=UPI0012674B52|nr:serine/threonine-protein phosphatase 4 regulatory subunit 2 [Photinus pyralis]